MEANDLFEKIKKTMYARYEAQRRMKRSKLFSNVALTMLSLYLLSANIFTLIPSEKNCCSNIINTITLFSIVFSAFILILSLLIGQLRYDFREQNYLKCADELNSLITRYQIRFNNNDNNNELLQPLSDEYFKILDKYNLNHEDIDYQWAYKNDKKWHKKVWLVVRWYILDIYMLYLLLIVLPPIIIIYLANTAQLC